MKGRKYTKKQIGRALAAYDVAGGNSRLASRLAEIPRSTIHGWANDEKIINDEKVNQFRTIEKDELQQKCFTLADAILPRIIDKATEDDVALRDLVGALAQAIEKGLKLTGEGGDGVSVNVSNTNVQQPANERQAQDSLRRRIDSIAAGAHEGNGDPSGNGSLRN